MNDINEKLREVVRKLLAEGQVDLVIGHEEGTLPLTARPCFLTSAEDADRLVWNAYCRNNLAVYLPALFRPDPYARRGQEPKRPKVGIVVKGCDARSVVGHIKENQIRRDDVIIIAMPCAGMVDLKKIRAGLQGREPFQAQEHDGQIVVEDEDGNEHTFELEAVLSSWCLACRHPSAPVYDIQIEGEPVREAASDSFQEISDFEQEDVDDRWAHFEETMSKCIRCYACRNACPLCYCNVCFAEETRPRWIGIQDQLSDVMAYQIGRIFHTAGRCVECGACEAACPMDVDLRTFTRKLVKDAKELFGYEAGMDAEEPPPLATFRPDDPNEFVH